MLDVPRALREGHEPFSLREGGAVSSAAISEFRSAPVSTSKCHRYFKAPCRQRWARPLRNRGPDLYLRGGRAAAEESDCPKYKPVARTQNIEWGLARAQRCKACSGEVSFAFRQQSLDNCPIGRHRRLGRPMTPRTPLTPRTHLTLRTPLTIHQQWSH